MVDTTGLVITSQYKREAAKWLQSLKRKENVSVVFFPKTDRLIRLQQFLQDKVFMKSVLGANARFFFQVLDFESHIVEDPNEMYVRIAAQMNYSRLTPNKPDFGQWMTYLRKHDVTLVLVLPQAEKYLTVDNIHILSYLSSVVDAFSSLVVSLCFFEVDFIHSSLTRMFPVSTRLYQNIHYYPLYSTEDTLRFIRYLGKKWKTPISKNQETRIVEQCGGHFWLIKEAVRQMAAGNSNPFNQEGIRFRLRTIYDHFLPSEQSLLAKMSVHKQTFEPYEKESLRYFQKMNFMNQRGTCLVQLFEDFVAETAKFKGEFMLRDGKILLNEVPVDRMFSYQERRMVKMFLQKKGEIVTRDEIAAILWPTNTQDNYSDWAIDQIIARLRKRLSELYLSPKLLRSVRGKGYLLNLLSP